jgi:hypothetical protein
MAFLIAAYVTVYGFWGTRREEHGTKPRIRGNFFGESRRYHPFKHGRLGRRSIHHNRLGMTYAQTTNVNASSLSGMPIVTVTINGPLDGGDFGPKSTNGGTQGQTGGVLSTSNGVQEAYTFATANNAMVLFEKGVYTTTTTITHWTGLVVFGNGATVQGNVNPIYQLDPTVVTWKCRVFGEFIIKSTSAGNNVGFNIISTQDGYFDVVTINTGLGYSIVPNNALTPPAPLLDPDTTGNVFMLRDYSSSRGLYMSGTVSGPVALNTFPSMEFFNNGFIGLEMVGYVDTNFFGSIYMSLGFSNCTGVKFNTGVPASDNGVDNNHFALLSIDSENVAFTGLTGLLVNYSSFTISELCSAQTQATWATMGTWINDTQTGSSYRILDADAVYPQNILRVKNSYEFQAGPSSVLQKAETGADANVLTAVIPAYAASYRLFIALDCTTWAANMSVTLKWTDSGGNVRTLAMQLQDATLGTVVTVIAATGNYGGIFPFNVNNAGTAPVVAVTGAVGNTYKITAVILPLNAAL